jgi:hypothetical protein
MRRTAGFLTLLLLCASAQAADVWVLEGNGITQVLECKLVIWKPGLVVHNRGNDSVTIRPMHVSNGGVVASAQTVPAGSSARAIGGTAGAGAWISRFDIPDTLGVEARMELYSGTCIPLGAPPPTAPFAKIRMPVFRRLVAAGEEQVHYGTDLGGIETRQNVGVYNAGEAAANVVITVKQPFCGTTSMQTALIPADTFAQVSVQNVSPCSTGALQSNSTYTVVTVDQPSLSFVSTLRNGVGPDVTANVTSGN